MIRTLMTLLALTACKDDSQPPTDDTDADSAPDSVPDSDSAPTEDACAALGLEALDFDPSGSDWDFGQLAPDFAWDTQLGPFQLSEGWTGCDTYLFVNYYPDGDYPVSLRRAGKLADLLEEAPLNMRLFFFVYPGQDGLDEGLAQVQETVDEALAFLEEPLYSHWSARVHVVLDSGWEADGVSGLNQQYYTDGSFVLWTSAIDRFQRVRELGYLCDPATGWEECLPEFLKYEAQYFNFEAERQARLDAETVTEVSVWQDQLMSDGGWAGVRSYAEIELPEDMTVFDTLELDLSLECVAYPSLVNCPAWDYLVHLYLCDADDPGTDEDESTTCDIELGRWITTYWLPGRWVHDVSPFLALLQEGGTRRLAFYTQQPYHVSLTMRLSDRGKGMRPVSMEPLYKGGTFDSRYNWGQHHTLSGAAWSWWLTGADVQEVEIFAWDEAAGYFVGQNAATNRDNPGLFTRVDWTWTEGQPALCVAVGDASSAEEAAAAALTCAEDDPDTQADESLVCTGADPADLATGCNGGAWTVLESASDDTDAQLLGDWLEVWHTDKLPTTLSPPAGAAKVELTSVVSGHGFGNTQEACAEFCDHQHRYIVNDTQSWTLEHPTAGTRWGCADQVVDGVVPNQAGTWVYGRAGWCPGLEVRLWNVDITEALTLGADNQLEYIGLFEGDPWYEPQYNSGYSSTDARIDLNSWVVVYE